MQIAGYFTIFRTRLCNVLCVMIEDYRAIKFHHADLHHCNYLSHYINTMLSFIMPLRAMFSVEIGSVHRRLSQNP